MNDALDKIINNSIPLYRIAQRAGVFGLYELEDGSVLHKFDLFEAYPVSCPRMT